MRIWLVAVGLLVGVPCGAVELTLSPTYTLSGGVGLSYFYPTHSQLGGRANVLLTAAVGRGPFEIGWRHQSNGEYSDNNSSWNALYLCYRFHWESSSK